MHLLFSSVLSRLLALPWPQWSWFHSIQPPELLAVETRPSPRKNHEKDTGMWCACVEGGIFEYLYYWPIMGHRFICLFRHNNEACYHKPIPKNKRTWCAAARCWKIKKLLHWYGWFSFSVRMRIRFRSIVKDVRRRTLAVNTFAKTLFRECSIRTRGKYSCYRGYISFLDRIIGIQWCS